MSPVLTLVLLPFEASKVQDQGLHRCLVTAIINQIRKDSGNLLSLQKSILLLNNVSAHPSKAPTNSYSNRISFIFVRFGLK